MSVLKLKYVLPVLLAAVPGAAAVLPAQFDPVEIRVDSLGARIDSLVAVHDELVGFRAGMLVRSSDLSARIDRFREGGGPLGPLDKYRLNSVLALSQSLADSLDLVNARLDGIQQEIDGLRLDAVAACTAALDSLSRLMKDSPAGPRGMLAMRFDRLRARRQRLASVDGEPGRKGQQGQKKQDGGESRISLADLAGLVETRPQDSPEEIAEKSAFLTDIEIRWSRALQALEQSLVRLDEERVMRSRLGEFTQELALFDKTGPSSRAAAAGDVNGGRFRPDDGARQPMMERGDNFADLSLNTSQVAGSISLDIQMTDPETELRLMQELGRFSADDITGLATLLRSRRDSLAADLDSLRELHERLNGKTDLD